MTAHKGCTCNAQVTRERRAESEGGMPDDRRPTKLPKSGKLGTGTRAIRRPVTHAGRAPVDPAPVHGEKLKHHWTKETEDECIALAKRGADIDEIAVIIDLRPGQVRFFYGKVIDRELALLNLEVEEAMYRNANGVKLPDTHVSVSVPKGSRTPIITKVPLLKHYPPNQAAATFILKNRRAVAWKDEPAVIVSRDDAAAAIRARVKEMKEAGG